MSERPTTDKEVHFRHTDIVPVHRRLKKYTFVSTGRYEGSYTRTVEALTLVAARDKLREDFPSAKF